MELQFSTLVCKFQIFYSKIKVSLFLAQTNKLLNVPSPKIRIRHINDPFKEIPSFYLIKIVVTHNQAVLTFSGTDKSFKKALIKTISEMSEFIFHNLNGTTNSLNRSGTGAHKSLSEAKQKSYLELLERDTFLAYFLSKNMNFQLLQTREIKDLKLKIIKIQSIDKDIDVIISTIFVKEKKQIFIGLKSFYTSKTSIQKAFEHSLQESIMLYLNWANIEISQADQLGPKLQILSKHLNSTYKHSIINKFIEPKCMGRFSPTRSLSIEQFKNYEINKIGNRFVCFGSNQSVIKLTFDEEWKNDQILNTNKLKKRGLIFDEWDYHPLL